MQLILVVVGPKERASPPVNSSESFVMTPNAIGSNRCRNNNYHSAPRDKMDTTSFRSPREFPLFGNCSVQMCTRISGANSSSPDETSMLIRTPDLSVIKICFAL